jgi:hypothetical protein
MDAALRLRHRHTLHAVNAALELQPRVDALARRGRAAGLHRHGDVLEAAEVALGPVQQLGPPAPPLGVAQVHAQQITGEQRGLLAALPRLDLEDDVAVVVGVARHEEAAQPVAGVFVRLLQRGQLGGEVGVLGGEFAGRRGVTGGGQQRAVGVDDLAELGVPAPDRPGARGVGVQAGVGEGALEVGVLGQQWPRGLRQRGVEQSGVDVHRRDHRPLGSTRRSGVVRVGLSRTLCTESLGDSVHSAGNECDR